jgi:hypothetical protein
MPDRPIKTEIIRVNERPTTWRENWEVMKPFVHFAFKAMTIIGSALIGIIKLLPTLAGNTKPTEDKKNNRIIKI